MTAFFHAPHGGADSRGQAPHDFSTNANAAGPCPEVVARLREVNACHYPDFDYTALRSQIAAHEGVSPARIVLAASASEAITRLTAAVRLMHVGAQVFVPSEAYGDYARAAAAWQLPLVQRPEQAQLIWQCEPSSPAGQLVTTLPDLIKRLAETQTLVLDLAYAPLRLDGNDAWLADPASDAPISPEAANQASSGGAAANMPQPPHAKKATAVFGEQRGSAAALTTPQADAAVRAKPALPLRDRVWRMVTPNKALGLTGIRGAYLLAPVAAIQAGNPSARLLQHLLALAPSWPVGSHGVCMLQAWCEPAVQLWVQESKKQLRQWRTRQLDRLKRMGWRVQPSVAPYALAQPPVLREQRQSLLVFFRERGVKLRDATNLGAPGWLRLAVRPPSDQVELEAAWQAWELRHKRCAFEDASGGPALPLR